MNKGFGMMPNEILYNNDISDKAKLLYVTISGLCAEKGYCWASNKYIAEKFNTSARTISRRITELKNYIDIETVDKGKTSEKRSIKLKDKNVYTPTTNLSTPPRQKCLTNNISNNNINIYNYYLSSIRKVGPYNLKYNKKALSLERINKALKIYNEDKVKSIIDLYIKSKKEDIANGYGKMCQYFFGSADMNRGKVLFYEDFLEEAEVYVEKKKVGVDITSLI